MPQDSGENRHVIFRKRSKTTAPQEEKISNSWEEEKKFYQSTIEKLTANKVLIYANLGSAVARQAKDDPTVLSPYPTQAAALNDIERETEALKNESSRRKTPSGTGEIPGRKSVRAEHATRSRRNSAVYAVPRSIKAARTRQPTTFRVREEMIIVTHQPTYVVCSRLRQATLQRNHRATSPMKAPYISSQPNPISVTPPRRLKWHCLSQCREREEIHSPNCREHWHAKHSVSRTSLPSTNR